MKKRWRIGVLAGILLSLGCFTDVFAQGGTWKSNFIGWWYQYEDGTYPKNVWSEINGYQYYFDREGYMVTGWNKIGGIPYCFRETGELAKGWCYNDSTNRWHYFNEDGSYQRNWLYDNGSWYWFSYYGEMAEGGLKNIDGKSYYFFDDGRMAANQYVGLEYMDENGIHDSTYDIVLEGRSKTIGKDERNRITEAMKNIPRGWIRAFNESGWKLMYYTDKSYFSAPDTEDGVYYVYHKLDSSYKKLKFINPDSLTKAFGEYIGYASGCYEENSEAKETLLKERTSLMEYVSVPSYFEGDMKFYFGMLTQAYLGWDTKNGVASASETAFKIMTDLLYSKEKTEEKKD